MNLESAFEPPHKMSAPFEPASSVPNSFEKTLESLNPPQREAVEATEGPLIVLAGAGSGKTKMLTARIANLMHQGIPPWQILAVTFTNKAAKEMKERVERTLHGTNILGAPEIGTFHSVCIRILRYELRHTPFDKSFAIYDDSDQLSLIKGVLKKMNLDEKSFSPKRVQGSINRAKCDALEPHEIEAEDHDIYARKFQLIYEQYQKDLFANQAVDFGEIITMVYRLFRDNPEVRSKYQKRYRYVHVDEYQDTNRAQYLLLSTLVSRQWGGHQNICVVGDEDQSIYKWRGADIRNILDFEGEYSGARVVKLEQNYRSTQNIIAGASHVIRNNRERKDKTLWTAQEAGPPIVRVSCPDERAEAEIVVSEIKRIATEEGRSFNDFAIFYRTHAQSRQFEDVLRREKVGYVIVGGLRFYDRKEIKDILAYLRVLWNPDDSISMKRILNVPARGIGKTTMDRIEELQIQMERNGVPRASYWAALNRAVQEPELTSKGVAKKIASFVQIIERLLEQVGKLKVSELYHRILDETAYVQTLKEEATEESLARIDNLEEFDTLLQEFEEENFDRLPESEQTEKRAELLPLFLEQASLNTDVTTLANTPGAGLPASVQMMSLHSSKGLEFPVVFLVGMEEGLFPAIRAWEEESEGEIEEERRLCYVGMTRARERLYMSHVAIRRLWGNVTYQEPARFFDEIPEKLIQLMDVGISSRVDRFMSGNDRKSSYPSSQINHRTGATSSVGSYSGGAKQEWVGKHVDHPEYGSGTIIQQEGIADQLKVTIEFKGRDRRKFLFKYIRNWIDMPS